MIKKWVDTECKSDPSLSLVEYLYKFALFPIVIDFLLLEIC